MRELAGNFMMVWSFFISKVTRELTLLSATSFGKGSCDICSCSCCLKLSNSTYAIVIKLELVPML